jgi:hypothetical protein
VGVNINEENDDGFVANTFPELDSFQFTLFSISNHLSLQLTSIELVKVNVLGFFRR